MTKSSTQTLWFSHSILHVIQKQPSILRVEIYNLDDFGHFVVEMSQEKQYHISPEDFLIHLVGLKISFFKNVGTKIFSKLLP